MLGSGILGSVGGKELTCEHLGGQCPGVWLPGVVTFHLCLVI